MISRYGVKGTIELLISLIYTKLFHSKSRIIRLPFDIRNKKYIDLGERLTTGAGCRLEAFPLDNKITLHIGKDVQINDYVHITAMEEVRIGNNVLLASKIYISDCSHGSYAGNEDDSSPEVPPVQRKLVAKPVIIEDNVWLGEFVSVLPGVTIGKGTIVGANSVVTKSLPPFVIAVGTPAIPIKRFNVETERWEKTNPDGSFITN
ncbi:acetyltransferase [Pedobacter cryoconitis]|uniref:Acetyltransferase n=1 Tax=Pedobacter cryoconitis TaxID=188932 RepID=A0A127VJ91_9SPHI|nr:DapH/DapD/GlmU-related protein [Pedobacter cryoconitis]AMQ01385.1 acetyltransferase [Pedobacter cryoconitis]